jgi:hypothetical protein
MQTYVQRERDRERESGEEEGEEEEEEEDKREAGGWKRLEIRWASCKEEDKSGIFRYILYVCE